MRLYEEVVKKINLAGGVDLFGCARCTLIFGGGGYFEGVRGLGDLSDDRVVLLLKSGVLEIGGERLGVEKYLDGDVELSGRIVGVRLLGKREWEERLRQASNGAQAPQNGREDRGGGR